MDVSPGDTVGTWIALIGHTAPALVIISVVLGLVLKGEVERAST
jgi:hypothetical protein